MTTNTKASLGGLLWKHRWVYAGVMLLLFFIAQLLYHFLIGPLTLLPWSFLLLMSMVGAHIIFSLSYRNEVSTYETRAHARAIVPKDNHAHALTDSTQQIKNKPHYFRTSTQDEIERTIQLKAQQEGVLVSEDGVKIIAHSKEQALTMLDSLIERAQKRYQQVDGWTVLDTERIEALQKNGVKNGAAKEDRRTQQGNYIPAGLGNGSLHLPFESHVRTLITLLKESDEKSLFAYIYAHREEERDWTRKVLAETSLALDNAYQHRINGTGYVDIEVLREVHDFSDQELEHLISVLSAGVDYRYDTVEVEPKLALLRALQFMEARKIAATTNGET